MNVFTQETFIKVETLYYTVNRGALSIWQESNTALFAPFSRKKYNKNLMFTRLGK